MENNDKGKKYDHGKVDYSLVPSDALEEIIRVLMYGAQKYDRGNWMHLKDAKRRYFSAACRHLFAILRGEEYDTESGYHHVAHAAACCLFLYEHMTKKDLHFNKNDIQ
jgi:hypothetical protein